MSFFSARCASPFVERASIIQLSGDYNPSGRNKITVEGIITIASIKNISRLEGVSLQGVLEKEAKLACRERLEPLVSVKYYGVH